MVSNGNVLIVREKRLVGAKEMADTRGVVDRSVEVGVVGDVDRFDEGGAGDRVEGRLGCLSTARLFVSLQDTSECLAKKCPGLMAERHERVERWSLTGFDQSRGQQVGHGAGMEVEEMNADSDAQVLLTFKLEGPEWQMREGEIGGGLIGFGKPASSGRGGSFCHGE
jgi:hypothetical protein